MAAVISKDTFDPAKNYRKLLFSRTRPLTDFEVNELQDLDAERDRINQLSVLPNGPLGDAFKVLASPINNTITVLPGVMWVDGNQIILTQAKVINILTTPGVNRTDFVYIEFYLREVDSIEDPNLIDPNLSQETATRLKLEVDVKVQEGGPIQQPIQPDRRRLRIARLERQAGQPLVLTSMIFDERDLFQDTFIVGGARVEKLSLLQVTVEPGVVLVADQEFLTPATVLNMPALSERFVFVDATGAILHAGQVPVDYFVEVLAFVKTNSTQVIEVKDLRTFVTKAEAVILEVRRARGVMPSLDERLDVSLNEDGTLKLTAAFGGCIDLPEICILKPEPTDPPSLQINVQAGRYIRPDNSGANDWPGGLSPFFLTAVTFNRIDLLMMRNDNTLEIIQGIEAPSPFPPVYPIDKIPIAEALIRVGTPCEILVTDIRDVRPFINLGGGGGGATFAPALYERQIAFAGQNNFFLATGSYVPGNNSLMIYRNGKLLDVGLAYIEINPTQIQLDGSVAEAGDIFVFIVPRGDPALGHAPVFHETQIVNAGLIDLDITVGFYTPGSNSLWVYRNGKFLVPELDYFEVNPTRIRLTFPTEQNDIFVFRVNKLSQTSEMGIIATDVYAAKAGVDIEKGDVLYISGRAEVKKAIATDTQKTDVSGAALGLAPTGLTVRVKKTGVAEVRFKGGLTLLPRQIVYLSRTAGLATNTVADFMPGDAVVELGVVFDELPYNGAEGARAIVLLGTVDQNVV